MARISRLSFGIASQFGFRGLATLLVVTWTSSMAVAQLPIAELTALFPPGGKQGSSVELTIAGGSLEDVTGLQFSHDGITAQQKMSEPGEFESEPAPRNDVFTVSIDGGVPAGVYECRVVTRYGVSNPRSFVVGTREQVIDDGANATPESAREIPINVSIHGRVNANAVDYFRVPLTAGQQIVLDCQARRIDSRMDAAIVVHDADGRELARSQNTIGTDPLLVFKAPTDGPFQISVYDFVYAGGQDYYYVLDVHDQPVIQYIVPAAVAAGTTSEVTVFGHNLPQGKPIPDQVLAGSPLESTTAQVTMPEQPADQLTAIAGIAPVRRALLDAIQWQLDGSNPVPVYVAEAPIVVENEPGRDSDQVQTIQAPCEVSGQFFPSRDVDRFEFEAKQGQVWIIDLVGHRLGREVDPLMLVQRITLDAEGNESASQVAQVDDPGDRNGRIGSDFDASTDDPTYRLEVKEDGRYRILVRDQFGSSRPDPRNVYRLVIRAEAPDFRLLAYPEQIKVANNNQVLNYAAALRKGGVIPIKVRVERRDGFSGAVEVTAAGLPESVQCRPVVIGAHTDSAYLMLVAAPDAGDWTGKVRLVGKSDVNGQSVERQARYASVVWGTGNRTQLVPVFRATRDLVVSVTDSEQAPGRLETPAEVLETSLGGKLPIPVTLQRAEDFKEAVKLVATDLPKDLKPGDITINGDKNEGTIELAVTNNKISPGIYSFYLRADTKVKRSQNPDAITRAEARQKAAEALLPTLDEQVKAATTANDELTKVVQTATAALEEQKKQKAEADKQLAAAQQEVDAASEKLTQAQAAADKEADNTELKQAAEAAEKQLQEATTRLEAARKDAEAKAQDLANAQTAADDAAGKKKTAEKALKQAQEKKQRGDQFKKQVDQDLANVKKNYAEKDINIALVSTPITVRVVASPIDVTVESGQPVTPEQTTQANLKLTRKYGFADNVELTLEVPKGVDGLKADKLTLNKDQQEGALVIQADKSAKPGTYEMNVKASLKFNNLAIETNHPLTVTVVEPK